jgi:hypothetical protein
MEAAERKALAAMNKESSRYLFWGPDSKHPHPSRPIPLLVQCLRSEWFRSQNPLVDCGHGSAVLWMERLGLELEQSGRAEGRTEGADPAVPAFPHPAPLAPRA